MWWVMAIQAIAFASRGLFDHAVVRRFPIELGGISVAIQADGVIVRLAHLDRQFVRAGTCLPDMTQSSLFGLYRSQDTVVGMAAVAVLTLDVPILIVYRRERLAARILQVVNEGLHDMTRHAEFHVLGLFESNGGAQEHHGGRQEADAYEKQPFRTGFLQASATESQSIDNQHTGYRN